MILTILKFLFLTLCVFFLYYTILFSLSLLAAQKNRSCLEKELPVFINNMIYSIKAGISPISFFVNYDKANSILKIPIQNLIKRIQAGQSLLNSLMIAKNEISLKSYHFFFTALCIGLKNGGNICPVLEKIKKISLSQNTLKRFVKTKSIQLKLQAIIIAILPVFIFLFLGITNPTKISNMFSSLSGLRIFLTASLTNFMGIIIVYKIIESPLKNKKIEELLYMLDLMSLTMHGGKNLTAAIDSLKELSHTKTINNFLLQFDKELKKGKSFLESFGIIKKFFPSNNCNQIIFLLEENISHGISIKTILDELTCETRKEIESQISSDIEKIPIKLLLPLMLLIAPSTLTLILYPIIFQ